MRVDWSSRIVSLQALVAVHAMSEAQRRMLSSADSELERLMA